jgi:hypothetical protein
MVMLPGRAAGTTAHGAGPDADVESSAGLDRDLSVCELYLGGETMHGVPWRHPRLRASRTPQGDGAMEAVRGGQV